MRYIYENATEYSIEKALWLKWCKNYDNNYGKRKKMKRMKNKLSNSRLVWDELKALRMYLCTHYTRSRTLHAYTPVIHSKNQTHKHTRTHVHKAQEEAAMMIKPFVWWFWIAHGIYSYMISNVYTLCAECWWCLLLVWLMLPRRCSCRAYYSFERCIQRCRATLCIYSGRGCRSHCVGCVVN